MSELDAAALAARLSTRTPTGIAEQIQQMIAEGALTPGTRLPTVRDIAQELEVSVGTIAQAWGMLREEQAVETRRRGGTRVVDTSGAAQAAFTSFADIDLLMGSPDRSLLPNIEASVAAALRHPQLNVWAREPITPDLRRAAEQSFPYQPEAWLAVGGGSEGMWTALHAAAEPGAPIALEVPHAPGTLEVARQLGLELLPVETDDAGPVPASLQQAVTAGAGAFALSPSGAFGAGHALTEERAQQLGAVVEGSELILIEDDPLGPLSEEPGASLGASFPGRTLRVLAYCRALGVDVRTALLAGPQQLVERAAAQRAGGLGSISRLLQNTLAEAIADHDVQRRIQTARRRYAKRKGMALEAFAEAGLTVRTGASSWSIWVEVADEQKAALALAGAGVVVDVSASSYITPPEQGALRLTYAQLPEDAGHLKELATRVSRAATGTLRPSFV